MNIDILLGKNQDHLVLIEGTKWLLNKQILTDFLKLQKEAREEGFNLQIASAFRDFERQKKIWNLKASGERELLDDDGRPLEFSQLSPTELVFAILRWSALPGCSRHHWGTDIDIYDGSTQSQDDVKLLPSETIGIGPAARLHDWLDKKFVTKTGHGFFRPYATDRGGVSPERWHLSHGEISRRYLEAYTFSIFKKNIEENDFLLKDILIKNAHEIYQRFFINVDLS